MIGKTIGHYNIQGRIGTGGMGVVYRAMDLQLDRTVALKFLPQHLNRDQSAKERFIQEAKAASALDHTNICTIYDIGQTDDGDTFIVMAYYTGRTLKFRLDDGPLEEDYAVSLARQIAAGLSRAHLAGIIHRDIKPANIMVTDHGEVKIIDFGVAKLESSADLTKIGSTLGTVAYMSPEQARGQTATPSADLWSLGVVLYEMLSGRRPFEATYDQALLYAIANETPMDISEVAPGVSDETASVVRTLLAKDTDDRPATADEVLKLLGGSTQTFYVAAGESARGSAAPASLMKVALVFAIVGTLILGLVYGVMIGLGLPDWVFPAAVFLLMIGAPITLYASSLERRRARMNTGEAMSGLLAWLTLRKATAGGVLALLGLVIVSTAFMVTRSLGVGPAATLITSGVMHASDVLVVADFDDRTERGDMGPSISQALRVDLSQSSSVNLMDEAEISDVMQRMELPEGAPLTSQVAQEIAVREGAKATLVGDIATLGSSFVINLQLLEAGRGTELVSLRETARTDADIVDAVDRLSAGLREKIGESLITIRQSDPLAKVTTRSLDALRLYNLAWQAKNRDDSEGASTYALQAVEIDPEFAMAYRILAAVENNRHGSPSKMIEYATKAYHHRDRLSRSERLQAISAYHIWVERSFKKNESNWQGMLEEDPTDIQANNGLSLYYRYTGDERKALQYSHNVIRYHPKRTLGYINSYYAYTRTGEWDLAQAMIDSVRSLEPQFSGLSWMQHALYAESTGNYVAALDSFSQALENYSDPAEARFLLQYIGSIHMMHGQHARAAETLRRKDQIQREGGNLERILYDRLRFIVYRYYADGDRVAASAAIDAAFEEIPPSSLDTLAREYDSRGFALAAVGREAEALEVLAEQRRYVPEAWLQEDDARSLTEGMIAFTAGRYDEALQKLDWFRHNMNIVPRYFDFETGVALEASGRLDEAASRLETAARGTGWYGLYGDQGSSTLAYRALGNVYDQLGQVENAIAAYQVFVDRWANADAHLRPQVEEVKIRIAQLTSGQKSDVSGSTVMSLIPIE